MKSLTYFLLVTFFLPVSLLSQKQETAFSYNFEAGLFSQFRSGGNYFDKEGSNIEKNYISRTGDTVSWNVFDHSAILTGIYFDYKFNEQFKAGIKIPFAFYSQDPVRFDEYFIKNNDPTNRNDSLLFTQRREMGDVTNNRLLYTSINGKYIFVDPLVNKILPYVEGDVRIPFSFEDGTQDASQDYWDDYFFEVIAAAGVDFMFDKSSLRFKAAYDMRTEDMSDMFILNFKAALSTVEDTELYFQTEYAQSFDDPETDFNIYRRPYAETYWNLGFGFSLIYDFVVFNVNYNLPVTGKYYWRSSVLNLTMGYRF